MAMQLVRAPEFAESEKFETAERRYAVVLSAQITPESEDTPISVRVCNISAGGLMAIVPPHVALRGQVSIMIRHVGKLIGRIV